VAAFLSVGETVDSLGAKYRRQATDRQFRE
jgi:hypothetical protein